MGSSELRDACATLSAACLLVLLGKKLLPDCSRRNELPSV